MKDSISHFAQYDLVSKPIFSAQLKSFSEKATPWSFQFTISVVENICHAYKKTREAVPSSCEGYKWLYRNNSKFQALQGSI